MECPQVSLKDLTTAALAESGELSDVRHLDISKQELASTNGIPADLALMTNLEQLSLATNELTELPDTLSTLGKLVALNLNGNHFTRLPKVLGKLPMLSILDLRNNRITTLNSSMLSDMAALTKLMLRCNRIVELPSEISRLKELQLLSIRNNHLISVAPELDQLVKLQVFDARANQLKSIPPLGGLTSLLELDLQHNCLSELPSALSNLSSLARLSLGFNNFSEFPLAVVDMISLVELDLEANSISVVPADIQRMTSLHTLYLSSNKIKSLPPEIGKLSRLEKLHLARNNLRPASLTKLASLKKLADLDLEDNPLGNDIIAAEALRPLDFIPNLKLTPERKEQPGALRKGAGGSGMSGAGHRSLFTEGGVMAMFQGQAAGGESRSGSEENVRSSSSSSSSFMEGSESQQRERDGLIRDFFAVEDTNKAGLLRAKKEPAQQEDAHCCHFPFFENNDVALFCVLDGHAGQEAALAAAQLIPKELKKRLKAYRKENKKKTRRPTDMMKILHMAYLKVDEKLLSFQYEGCTATTVIVWQVDNERYLQCANVGDSAAYLYRAGEPICLTREHKLANEHERGRIVSSGVWLTDGQTRIAGIGVTRVLGDHFAKDTGSGMLGAPDSSPVYLIGSEDTHLVLASDGLWDVVTPASAGDLVARKETAEAAAKALMKRALGSPKCKDNVTIIVVNL